MSFWFGFTDRYVSFVIPKPLSKPPIKWISPMFRFALLLLLMLAGPVLAQEPVTFETDTLRIETEDGRSYPFEIELAITPQQQRRGLMFRDHLADDAGMLFLNGDDRIRRFWMKNTFIPLDILFIRADGTIANIARMTEPESEALIKSDGPVRAVLELRGGLTRELSITAGDRIVYPWLNP